MLQFIQKIINRWLIGRHFWRYVGFNELSEIYANQLMRSLAVNLVGIFVPIYLYQLGIDISEILVGYFIVFFGARVFVDYMSAHVVAAIGPKHTLIISAGVQIIHLLLLVTLDSFNWYLWIIALTGTIANGLFFVSFHVDFSKVKHNEHAGKELSLLWFFDRFGAVLGPLAGGLIASFFDPRYTIVLAIIVLLASLLPLFASPEPVKTKQQISFRGLPFKKQYRDYLAIMGFEIENVASVALWPLYVGTAVLLTNTYATLGLLVALSTSVALLATFVIGRRIDNSGAHKLFSIAAVANSLVHMARPFAVNTLGVGAINVVNDPVTAAYRMPFMKGYYDTADSLPGYRIAYITSMLMAGSLAKSIFITAVWLFTLYLEPSQVLRWQFPFVGVVSLLMLLQTFRALRK